jgi:hypothetical protein
LEDEIVDVVRIEDGFMLEDMLLLIKVLNVLNLEEV